MKIEDATNTGKLSENRITQKMVKNLPFLGLSNIFLGTTSLSDFFILNAYVFYTDSKVNSAEAFKTHCPTGLKIVEKMMGQCDKLKAAVEKAQAGQFCPF